MERIDNDFRYLDFILLEETFHQYSVLTPPERRYPEAVTDRHLQRAISSKIIQGGS
ncbi:MAG: hypothetical protein ACLUEQ_00235 [Cloacibacillus evryensis]